MEQICKINLRCLSNNSVCNKDTKTDGISEKENSHFMTVHLSLNVEKNKFMLWFHHEPNVNPPIPKLATNSEPITIVIEVNSLGLAFDEQINWTPHNQKISNKISRIIENISTNSFAKTCVSLSHSSKYNFQYSIPALGL